MSKLTFTKKNADRGKSIRINKLGIKIEVCLVQKNSLIWLDKKANISLDKEIRLGSKSFELEDLLLYTESGKDNKSSIV
jgi:hypothetical protein